MAVRMTGLMSNMDTETIIKELMAARRTKQTRVENKKTKLEWSQDKWKELNTKIYKLYTDSAAKMRLQSSYQTKKATSSNEDKALVKGSGSAPEGSHTLEVSKLASSQYVTSKKLTGVTSQTKLTSLNMESGTVINITSGTGASAKTAILDIDTNTTVADFVVKCKEAGINASYDEKQGRFFIGAKSSGAENTYTITSSSSSAAGVTARDNIRELVNYNGMDFKNKTAIDNALYTIQNASSDDLTAVKSETYDETTATTTQKELKSALDTISKKVEETTTSAVKAYVSGKVRQEIEDAIKSEVSYEEMGASVWDSMESSYSNVDVLKEAAGAAAKKVENDETLTEEETEAIALYKAYEAKLKNKVDTLVATDITSTANADSITAITNSILANGLVEGENTVYSSLAEIQSGLMTNISNYNAAITTSGTSESSKLSNLGLGEITGQAVEGNSDGTSMVVVAASDSVIKLNGATLTGTSNSIQVNGLTIDLKATTSVGETIKLNVSDDTQATYDMIKDFVTQYNSLLKEMNDLYYSSSAKGYEPLTDEEKEAMTDDQIEKWETKIKDSLLRRDNTLGTLTQAMKSALVKPVSVNGESITLSTFGIMTSTDYSEKGLLHIYGDSKDSVYSDKTDKLMAALTSDPEKVQEAFSAIAQNLYDTMADKMKSTSLSSALTFYNDKQMTKQVSKYDEEISKWEDRLKAMEDRYYSQFTAMEKALANLNSQSTYLSSLMGTGQ